MSEIITEEDIKTYPKDMQEKIQAKWKLRILANDVNAIQGIITELSPYALNALSHIFDDLNARCLDLVHKIEEDDTSFSDIPDVRE